MTFVLVCGGRRYADYATLSAVLNKLRLSTPGSLVIITGAAAGADAMAIDWAERHGVHHVDVPALWDVYRNGAGPRRNEVMARMKFEYFVAFPGGSGTADMVKRAKGLIPEDRVIEVR